jgi:pyrroline-5-carboxylate reductase
MDKFKILFFNGCRSCKIEFFKKKYYKKKVIFFDKTPNQNEIKKFDIIIFAIKPQIANKVLSDYRNFVFKKNILITSIVAGKKN